MCIRQIKYVSSDVGTRINKIKILSLLARSQFNRSSTKAHSTQSVYKNLNSNALNELPTNIGKQRPKSPECGYQPNHCSFVTDIDTQFIPSITTYFSIIHANQYKSMNYVGNLFETVGPMIIKLEFFVLGTKSGELDNMCLYYSFWKNQLYKLLSRYVAHHFKKKTYFSGNKFFLSSSTFFRKNGIIHTHIYIPTWLRTHFPTLD